MSKKNKKKKLKNKAINDNNSINHYEENNSLKQLPKVDATSENITDSKIIDDSEFIINSTTDTIQESVADTNGNDEISNIEIDINSNDSNSFEDNVILETTEDFIPITDTQVMVTLESSTSDEVKNAPVAVIDDDKTLPSDTVVSSEIISVENSNISENDDISESDTVLSNDYTSINDQLSSPLKKNKSKKWIILIISFIMIALLALFASTIFGLLNLSNTNIIPGTFISGIDVSGLSKEDAFEKVNSAYSEKLANSITLKHNDYESSIFAEQFEVNFDINAAIETAYARGRNGNIFENNFIIINSYFSSVNISPSFSYNDESIIALITEIEPNLPDRAIAPSYYIEGNNLIISKGVNGIIISSAELKSEIIYYFNNLLYKEDFIDIPVENMTVPAVDINKVHDEIYKAPQDAYYTSDPYVVHPHVDGVDFGISIEEATSLLSAEGENCTIPLKVLSPNVTTNQIGPEAFPDLLGEFSTTYNAGNYNRSTNISLASAKIDGIVIMPGEVFSYNKTVGQRTAAAGFKSAGVYVNGQVSTGIGGGICQVSSTLYNAVLLANLEIVERTNHYFNPGYVPAGKDATVSWGGPDFKFKNNRDYPIKIVCSGTGGKVNFKIWGLHSDDDYEVVVESKYIQSIPYKTIHQHDASLAKGASKVIESGSNGCKTETYKILKKNGTVVSRTLISRDTYNPHNRVVAVGN